MWSASAPARAPASPCCRRENATGNWVKVVQRLPVRLALDEAAPNLSGGLSAKVKVDVRAALNTAAAAR
jgi:multidrug resistance efflux pump